MDQPQLPKGPEIPSTVIINIGSDQHVETTTRKVGQVGNEIAHTDGAKIGIVKCAIEKIKRIFL